MQDVQAFLVFAFALLPAICFSQIQQGSINSTTDPSANGFANASNSSEDILYNGECTIESALYPNEFLSMKSGWVYKYAILAYGNPKSTKGNWNWRSIWRVTPVVSEGQQAIILRDHKTNKYLSFNRDMYSYLRGERNSRIKDNLWLVEKVGTGAQVTIKRFMKPREYLQAYGNKKYNERELVMVKELPPKAANWIIDCQSSSAND